jgi:hypothetical protein
MQYRYKNIKDGSIKITDKPLKGKAKENYQQIGWIKNMMINAGKILKK